MSVTRLQYQILGPSVSIIFDSRKVPMVTAYAFKDRSSGINACQPSQWGLDGYTHAAYSSQAWLYIEFGISLEFQSSSGSGALTLRRLFDCGRIRGGQCCSSVATKRHVNSACRYEYTGFLRFDNGHLELRNCSIQMIKITYICGVFSLRDLCRRHKTDFPRIFCAESLDETCGSCEVSADNTLQRRHFIRCDFYADRLMTSSYARTESSSNLQSLNPGICNFHI
ncbi:hypothetical protein BDN70DRAFT_288237 [Pholiota conissans]|uniref:Uncharacterized protein n=1 Tax=Pholiota conissans TaxID=109636 RepID=A0A9P5YUL9_9AGAR|nr:hypothetical protein BDN70DRAFT_288237 [Pholiota conissans]